MAEADTAAIKRVHNLIILDESGSMYGLEKVSVGGVNETIQTIKEAYYANPEQKQLLTMVTFSSQSKVRIVHHYSSHKIQDVEEMPFNMTQTKRAQKLCGIRKGTLERHFMKGLRQSSREAS